MYAPVYDWVGRWFMVARKKTILDADILPGQRVLLLGAGTGLDLELLPEDLEIHALDTSGAMLKRLQRRANKLQIPVLSTVGHGYGTPYPGGFFDVVLLHFVLEVVQEPQGMFNEAMRITKPGGKVVLLDFFHPGVQRPPLGKRILSRFLFPWFSGLVWQPEKWFGMESATVLATGPVAWRGLVRMWILQKPVVDGDVLS